MIESKLTVFFEDPFWVGLYEREDSGRYQVCKITFGAEPKTYDVYEFMKRNWKNLIFSPSVKASEKPVRRLNPKRMQREINKQLQETGIGTKAQQALKLQQEQGKLQRKAKSRQMREANKEKQFQQKQEKKKEKHKGH